MSRVVASFASAFDAAVALAIEGMVGAAGMAGHIGIGTKQQVAEMAAAMVVSGLSCSPEVWTLYATARERRGGERSFTTSRLYV